jgi:Protein of unknown function (DUF3102)
MAHMMRSLSKLPRAEQWADRICTQLGKSVEAIIETGRLLVKAKADLSHGEWGRLFDESLVPFSQNTAGRLMAVADNPVLANSAHVQNLPPSWGTLYELTKVPEPTLKNAIRDGVITPDMPRKAVADLVPVRALKSTEDPSSQDFRTDVAIVEVVHAIRSVAARWPSDVSMAPLIDRLALECTRLQRRYQEVEP